MSEFGAILSFFCNKCRCLSLGAHSCVFLSKTQIYIWYGWDRATIYRACHRIWRDDFSSPAIKPILSELTLDTQIGLLNTQIPFTQQSSKL